MDILLSRFVNKYINSLSMDDLKKLNEFLDIRMMNYQIFI